MISNASPTRISRSVGAAIVIADLNRERNVCPETLSASGHTRWTSARKVNRID
jgi:hypothetical protein